MPRPGKSNDGESKRPTLREVARQAGVSAMTVSRALRDSPCVTAPLRARLKRLAAKMGYRPDPEVTKLMVHLRRRDKAQLVAGLAAITSMPESVDGPILRMVFEGARERAEELGYRLELFRIKDTDTHDHALERVLAGRGIEGVLLLQMANPVSLENVLDWRRFATVAATPSVLAPDFPKVEANYFHNARLLCAQIGRMGVFRIGFVGSATFQVRTNEAFSAAAAWQALAAGKRAVPPLVLAEHPQFERLFTRWFRKERPEAVLAYAEEMVPLLRRQLDDCGAEETPVFCTSVNRVSRPCGGIDERHGLIGRKAVDVLTGMLNRNEKNLRAIRAASFIEGEWVASPARQS